MGEIKGYGPSDEIPTAGGEGNVPPVEGGKEEPGKFSYWLSGKIKPESVRPSFYRGTVIIDFDATAGPDDLFGGGGEGENAKRFVVEMSQKGYDDMMKATGGVGGIRHIVAKAGGEESPIWVTKEAIEARSKSENDVA